MHIKARERKKILSGLLEISYAETGEIYHGLLEFF